MRQPLDAYKAILCDLDGCLIAGHRVLPGSRAFIERFRDQLWILSNNSTDTADSLAVRLDTLGLSVDPTRIVLAGVVAVDELVWRNVRPRVSLYASETLRTYAANCGLLVDDQAPEVVLLARDLSFDISALSRLVAQLAAGATLVVTNEDATHPGPDGWPVPETGALLAAVRTCLPEINYSCFGKPHVAMYRNAFKKMNVDTRDIVAIGDNPATDGRGAAVAGIDFILVGPKSKHAADLGSLMA